MSKAIANSATGAGGQPANGSGGPGQSALENWLRRAMADLARRGADDEAPVDLTESLKAMAALLQEAVHSSQAPAPGRGAGKTSTAPREALRAEVTAPSGSQGSGEAAAGASLQDAPRALAGIEAHARAAGEESLRLALTDLETELARRAARAEPADASASEPGPGGGMTSPALSATLAPREADARIGDVGSHDALACLIEFDPPAAPRYL